MQKKWMATAIVAVFSWWVLPVQATVIDGDTSDWAGVTPVATPDVAGLGSLYFSRDLDNLYFWIDGLSANTDGSYFAFGLDVDQNDATGCAFESGIGVEIGGYFIAPGFHNIGDARDCGWSGSDFGATWSSVFTANGIEGSMALSNLDLFGWDGNGFDLVVAANAGWSTPFHVELAPVGVPVAPAVVLLLAGGFGLAQSRRRA